MTVHDITTPSQTWWIVEGPGVLHYGIAEPGAKVTTGQPTLLVYDNQEEWVQALEHRGVELPPDYVEKELLGAAYDGPH